MCARELGDIWGRVVHIKSNPLDGDSIRVIVEKAHDLWGGSMEVSDLKEIFKKFKPGKPLTVHLLNIDAPETAKQYAKREGKRVPFKGQGKFGHLAAEKLAQFLPDETPVLLEFDVQKTGEHDRPLAHVFTLKKGKNPGKDCYINAEMVRCGLALPYIISPSTRYAEHIRQAGKEADEKKVGMLPHLVYDRFISDPRELNSGEQLNEPFIYRRLIPFITCPGEHCPAFPHIDSANNRWLVDIKKNCYYFYEAYATIPAHERTWYPQFLDLKEFGFRSGRIEAGKCICLDETGESTITTDGMLTYTPFGASQQVAGSKHLFEVESAGTTRGVLVDCGLNHDTPTSDDDISRIAQRTDYVIITHAHLDHVGDLSRLLEKNQHVEIFLTYGTYYIMMETGKRQVNGQWHSLYKRYKDQFRIQPYHRSFKLCEGIRAQFWGAGHMPGAAQVLLEFRQANGKKRQILITGDIGPTFDVSILMSPENDVPASPDLMLCESTYGIEEKKPLRDSMMYLLDHVEYARLNNKKIICAAFSVMRTQAILLDFWKLRRAGLLSRDYKVVLKATQHSSSVKLNKYIAAWLTGSFLLPQELDFAGYPVEIFDPATAWELNGENPFNECICTDTPLAEQANFIIVADGMWNYGQAREALITNAANKDHIFLLAGYQAPDSNGGQLQMAMDNRSQAGDSPTAPRDIIIKKWNWDNEVIGKQTMVLHAEVRRLGGYMGHVDGPGRAAYIAKIRPRRLMLVHGDLKALSAAAEQLAHEFPGIEVELPAKGQIYSI